MEIQDLKTRLRIRVESNMAEYIAGIMALDKTEIIGKADEIATYSVINDLLQQGNFDKSDLQYLLVYENPLKLAYNAYENYFYDYCVEQKDLVGNALEVEFSEHNCLTDEAGHPRSPEYVGMEDLAISLAVGDALEDSDIVIEDLESRRCLDGR